MLGKGEGAGETNVTDFKDERFFYTLKGTG